MSRIITALIKVLNLIPALLLYLPRKIYEGKKYSLAFYKGPGIVVTNHRSFLDFPLLLTLFAGRHLRCVVGETLYRSSPFMTFLLKMLGCIPVNRFTYDLDFLNASLRHLERGGLLLIFPESKFNVNDEILEYKSSAVMLALQANVPVIPLYHTYRYGIGRRVKIAVGDPIDLSAYCTDPNPGAEILSNLSERLRRKVAQLRELQEKACSEHKCSEQKREDSV